MRVDSFNFNYSLFRSSGTGQINISILTSKNNGRTYLQASIIESDKLEYSMIDAKQITDKLALEGHIALYGIRFDKGSSKIKPDSEQALRELGQYLKQTTNIKILIVGHTDNEGGFDYNMALSKRRAGSVKKYLIDNYGISATRLHPEGVGFLAPVAPNTTMAGKSLNRRVEIVPN